MALQCLGGGEHLLRVVGAGLGNQWAVTRFSFLPERNVESYLPITVLLLTYILVLIVGVNAR